MAIKGVDSRATLQSLPLSPLPAILISLWAFPQGGSCTMGLLIQVQEKPEMQHLCLRKESE